MRYLTTHSFSPNIQETPEGFLLCFGVPIARTGVQEYGPDEIPVEPGKNGVVLVVRAEEDVFSPETIASFEGKSVTMQHPEQDPDPDVPDVNPENWADVTCGVAMNVRRGTGNEADLLLADLLITDADAIGAVRSGELRQVSCGYNADYAAVRPGVGRQHNIIGNHIALVPHGRAGGRVAIKDAARNTQEEAGMPKAATVKAGFWDRFTRNLKKGKTLDEAAQAAAQDEDMPKKDEEQQVATDSGDDIAALAAKVEELTLMVRALVDGAATADSDAESTADSDPEGTADEEVEKTADADPDEEPAAAKTGDARRKAGARVADAAMVRQAKAISPGLPVQVGDSALAMQKLALHKAFRDAALKGFVTDYLRGRTMDALSPAELDAAFCATATLARQAANKKTADALGNPKTTVRDFGAPVSPADINAKNAEFYGTKAG